MLTVLGGVVLVQANHATNPPEGTAAQEGATLLPSLPRTGVLLHVLSVVRFALTMVFKNAVR